MISDWYVQLKVLLYSKRSLESYFVPLDTFDCLSWDRCLAVFQLRGHIDWFPLDRRLYCLLARFLLRLIVVPHLSSSKDVLHRLRDLRSDTVTFNQTDCI
jgi:hypothetical protein